MALQLSQADTNIGATYLQAYIRVEDLQITFATGSLPGENAAATITITVGVYVDITQATGGSKPLATHTFMVPAAQAAGVINSLRTQAYNYLKSGPFNGAADA